MIEQKLKNNFDKINKVYFEEEGNNLFLRVEVDARKLETLEKISREISEWLDANNNESEKEYFLDIFSPGAELDIKVEDIDDHVSERVLVELNEPIKTLTEFTGTILETTDDTIKIKWDAKGQWRKQDIDKANIKYIKIAIKI